MKNLDGLLDIFLITNGRSTFQYALQSLLDQQDIICNPQIIKDLPWLEANLTIVSRCKSKYFLRVDDDMLLHPKTISFMLKCIKDQDSNIALRGWRLWEPYSLKVCKGIKIYNHKLVQMIGFRINELGKIDKPFTEDATKQGFKQVYTDDVVAIHSCSTFEEHLDYAVKRGEDKGKDFKKEKRWMRNQIGNFNLSLEQQYVLRTDFLETLNTKKKTDFSRYLKK